MISLSFQDPRRCGCAARTQPFCWPFVRTALFMQTLPRQRPLGLPGGDEVLFRQHPVFEGEMLIMP
jgi:hypothetical protein